MTEISQERIGVACASYSAVVDHITDNDESHERAMQAALEASDKVHETWNDGYILELETKCDEMQGRIDKAVEALERIADEDNEECPHCIAKQALTELKGKPVVILGE